MLKSPNIPKKADICIITFYDAPFRRFGDLAWLTMRKYAARHHLDPIRFQEASSDRPPSWEKIICIQKAFDLGYEFAFWIDADALIVDLVPDIRTVLREADAGGREKDFFLARHAIDGGLSPNMGILIVRNSERSRRILSELWNMKRYIDHRWWEQAAFIEYFGLIDGLPDEQQKFFEGSCKSRQADPDMHIGWIDERWNFIPGISGQHSHAGAIPPVIRHYAGKSWFRRLDGMVRDTVRFGYLGPKDGMRFALYVILASVAKTRLFASNLWLFARRCLGYTK